MTFMITLIIALCLVSGAVGWTVHSVTSGRRIRRRLKRAGDEAREQHLLECLQKESLSPPRVIDWAGMPIITSDMVPPGQVVIVSAETMSSPAMRAFLGHDESDVDKER